MARSRFIFSGSGGQGVITAGVILGEAAVLHEGLIAIQSQSYGPEARGGSARAEILISEEPINFPKVNNANVLACLTQESYNKYYTSLRPGGLLITDARQIKQMKKVDARQVALPLYDTAQKTLGNIVVLNICLLGAVISLTKVVRLESVAKVVETRTPPDFLPLNRQALQAGYDLGEAAQN